jgi:hypothetical protein
MHPTIRDVAKKLNLSITTISRAFDSDWYNACIPQTWTQSGT